MEAGIKDLKYKGRRRTRPVCDSRGCQFAATRGIVNCNALMSGIMKGQETSFDFWLAEWGKVELEAEI